MREARPESTPLPADDVATTLQVLTFFDQLEVTDETASAMRVGRADHKDRDLGRITQLINKTNQYNLTTIRRTLDEARALANSGDWRFTGCASPTSSANTG